ncbi:MAG: DUF202 domain-containing protein [Candidatus Aminicenantes bacterium]|nr:DUF202 domain-containing protein [Candidatus Aminicenantes bacterium]
MRLRRKQKRETIYSIDKKNLIIRDHLAADRTALSNERTFLSYIRTSIALFAGGFGLIKFITNLAYNLLGWILVGLGIIVLIIGIMRFIKFNKSIKSIGCSKMYKVIEPDDELKKEIKEDN